MLAGALRPGRGRAVIQQGQAPTGLARRARRLSDAETGQRMLQAALAMVNQSGLTVSLEHISFEDVIREAGVSRSAVYRRWPYKDLFFSDLVKELARDTTPDVTGGELELIQQIIARHEDWLQTPQQRHELLLELFRELALFDFQSVYGSPGWRTYLALHATFLSLADGQLRDEVQAALAESERRRAARIAAAWAQLTRLFGYRLRPETGASFGTLATLLSAALRGLVIMALSTPALAGERLRASPFGAAAEQEWSLPALGLASVASGLLEPDPDVSWDDERVAYVRAALRQLQVPDA